MRSGDDAAAVDSVDVLLELLRRRLHLVLDSSLDGDHVFDTLARCAPRGAATTLFGSSNIKGTGLGFVYCCLAADRTRAMAARVPTAGLEEARSLLRRLATPSSTGRVDCEVAIAGINALDLRALGRTGPIAADAERALVLLRERQAALLAAWDDEGPRAGSGGLRWRAALDITTSLACRRDADRLMRDLGDHRVGLARAVDAARAINDREKG